MMQNWNLGYSHERHFGSSFPTRHSYNKALQEFRRRCLNLTQWKANLDVAPISPGHLFLPFTYFSEWELNISLLHHHLLLPVTVFSCQQLQLAATVCIRLQQTEEKAFDFWKRFHCSSSCSWCSLRKSQKSGWKTVGPHEFGCLSHKVFALWFLRGSRKF